MTVKIAPILLMALALFSARPVFCQSDVQAADPPPKKILIAKGDSYLENTVAAMLIDSCASVDMSATAIALGGLDAANRQEYDVVVVFSAIKRGRISAEVNKYITTTKQYGTHSNLLICNVFGENVGGRETSTDAVTTATKILSPEPIVSRILANIRLILKGKQ